MRDKLHGPKENIIEKDIDIIIEQINNIDGLGIYIINTKKNRTQLLELYKCHNNDPILTIMSIQELCENNNI
jgi:hypothetical protein